MKVLNTGPWRKNKHRVNPKKLQALKKENNSFWIVMKMEEVVIGAHMGPVIVRGERKSGLDFFKRMQLLRREWDSTVFDEF